MSPVLSGGTSYYISPVTWLPWAHQHLSGPGSLTGSPSAGRGAPRGGQGGHGSCGPLVPGTGSAGALPTQPRACPAPGGLTSASRVQTQAHWPWPCCPGSRRGAVQENTGGSACRTHGKGLGPSPAWKVGSSRGRLPGSPGAVQPLRRALEALPSPASRASSSPPLASPGSACPPGFLDSQGPCCCLSAFDSALSAPTPCAFPFLPCELVHTAWDPTPRPDFSVAWAGAAPWVQGGRDVAPEPGGTARAATGPFPDQVETRWVARRGLIPPKRALRPVASLPRTHGAQPGDILGGQNQALRARGRQRTGAV